MSDRWAGVRRGFRATCQVAIARATRGRARIELGAQRTRGDDHASRLRVVSKTGLQVQEQRADCYAPIASMFFSTTSIVCASSVVGWNSTTSEPV